MKTLIIWFCFWTPFFTFASEKPIPVETVEYKIEEKSHEGILFRTSHKNAPTLFMIHNWLGITEETKKQAIRFQTLGYNVFAVDVYGKGIRPNGFEEASKLATFYKTNRSVLRKKLEIALTTLQKQKGIDAHKIAAIGYCFGGTSAIELGRSGADLKGIISFHGGLDSPTPADGKNIHGKMLILHGDIDPYVPEKDINAFKTEMRTHKIDYEFISYPNTVHSFTEMGAGTDITKGAAYNEEADKRSFNRATLFLEKLF